MKVKELIDKLTILKDFGGDLDIWVCDEVEGNDCPIKGVEISQTGYDYCNPKSKPENVIMIRWGGQ